MRKLLTLLLAWLLVFTTADRVKAASNSKDQPVVHAILFWTNGCQFCAHTLSTTLPALQDKYQEQLSIQLIELANLKDVDNLYAIGASLGLAKEQIAVPLMLIDQTALIGVDEIDRRLPGLIESYLSEGGVEVPDMPILNQMLIKSIEFVSSTFNQHLLPQVYDQANSTGMTLAWVIMVFMWLALIAALVLIVRAFQGKPLSDLKGWADFAIPILALIGLGASIYLTYVELTHTRALCGPVGDCNAVQSSPYAKLFGILPIGLLGAIGYIAILVIWLWRRLRTDSIAKIAGPAMCAMALFGTLFSIYLTYLELFVIHAVCIWCLSSAVIITIIMLLSLPPTTQWLAISDEED
ncbi:MAG TPA: vitamin K epoxide reductase family protein [Anaerolineales bacterium]|nr:vitamin K epoxide reductase family protein [Anaerolineales bacterium]